MAGMLVLLGDDLPHIRWTPVRRADDPRAAIVWAFGTVLLRKWKPAVPQNTLTGWMMLVGWVPLVIAAPVLDPMHSTAFRQLSATAWFAILYNIFFAGTIAHWAWFTLARTLPVAVSSLSSLPVPVVGVFAGMIVLGERPGPAEWIALALVIAALVAVLWRAAEDPTSRPSRRLGATRAPESASASCRSPNHASRFALHRSPIACRVSRVALPTCGSSTTLSIVSSARRNVRLVGEHVEPGALDRAGLQRGDERGLVDDRAARDVDDRALLAERGEHVAHSTRFFVAAPPGHATTRKSDSAASALRSGTKR